MSRRQAAILLAACTLCACTKRDRPEPKPEPDPPRDEAKAAAPAVRPKDPEPRKQEPETADGYQVIRARTKTGEITELKVKAPRGWDVLPAPTSPDPHGGEFTLKQATAGLEGEGQLAVRIQTSMGSFYCDLFPDKAPKTVANFVGLARGKRKFWDGKEAAWVARPYYDGTEFHRVVPGFMIQGGDHTGTGKGGIGYNIPDEVHPTLRHDRPGQLCMANRGPNTGEAQFFITEAPAPHLDRSYTIFGQCSPATLVQRISRVPQSGRPRNRPLTPVKIEQVEVRRVQGGAAAWMPDSARLPPMPGLQTPGGAVQVGAEGEPAAPKQP